VKIFSKMEGIMYLIHSFLMIVPSQILPQKLNWPTTYGALSLAILGKAAVKAGPGLPERLSWTAMSGGTLASPVWLPLWARSLPHSQLVDKRIRQGEQRPVLFKSCFGVRNLCLDFNIIRADLGGLWTIIFWYFFFHGSLINYFSKSPVILMNHDPYDNACKVSERRFLMKLNNKLILIALLIII